MSMEDWGTPDGWWNTVIARAFDARQSEPYVAWCDLTALREENATLRAGLEATANHRAKVERELDTARAEAVAARHELRVAQADLERQIKETEKVWAEVARLEGLILDWEDDPPGSAKEIVREARRIRAQREGKCPECEGTGATGAGVPCCIRAQREGDGIDRP